jgi:hypothetical protein
VSLAGAGAASLACHANVLVLPVLFGGLELALVDCPFLVTYVVPCDIGTSMIWPVLLSWLLLLPGLFGALWFGPWTDYACF